MKKKDGSLIYINTRTDAWPADDDADTDSAKQVTDCGSKDCEFSESAGGGK
jgi:hypothetical protein